MTDLEQVRTEACGKLIGFVGPVLACVFTPEGYFMYNRWTGKMNSVTEAGTRWLDQQFNDNGVRL